MIDLTGKNKAEVLAALYNASQPLGMGILHYDPTPMTVEQAQSIIDEYKSHNTQYFDYLKGRVMKIDLSGDTLDPRLYDRDNGQGKAEMIISQIN